MKILSIEIDIYNVYRDNLYKAVGQLILKKKSILWIKNKKRLHRWYKYLYISRYLFLTSNEIQSIFCRSYLGRFWWRSTTDKNVVFPFIFYHQLNLHHSFEWNCLAITVIKFTKIIQDLMRGTIFVRLTKIGHQHPASRTVSVWGS